eukprot:1181416-Prorocentrum_minimum.AAC.3
MQRRAPARRKDKPREDERVPVSNTEFLVIFVVCPGHNYPSILVAGCSKAVCVGLGCGSKNWWILAVGEKRSASRFVDKIPAHETHDTHLVDARHRDALCSAL